MLIFSNFEFLDQFAESYFDLSADENGVWGVFGNKLNNHTLVMKIDAITLQPQYMWDIKVRFKIFETLFTCGSAGDNLARVVVVLGTILKFLHFLPLEGAKGNIR